MSEPSKTKLWAGRVLSALPVLALLGSGAGKVSHGADMVKNVTEKFGYQASVLTPLGLVELICAILYAIPQTSVLGAILLTGYLGGAVATHVRVGDPGWAFPIVFGVLVWGGLYLRDDRIAALIPLRKPRS